MLRERLENIVMFYGGPLVSILVVVILFVIAPAILLALFVWLLAMGRWGASRDGLVMGLAVSIWMSACWLLGGYIGTWLNILPGLFVTAIFGSSIEPLWSELLVVVMNFLVWPIAGWLFFGIVMKIIKASPIVTHEI